MRGKTNNICECSSRIAWSASCFIMPFAKSSFHYSVWIPPTMLKLLQIWCKNGVLSLSVPGVPKTSDV